MRAVEERRTTAEPVMVAYDGSAAARRGLLHAAMMVKSGGLITVVNVIPVQGVSARLETISDDQRAVQHRLLHEAHELLARQGVKTSLVGLVGDPLTELLAAAEDLGAATLVVGRGTRRRLHVPLGDRIVRRAKADVLVVR